MKNILVLILVFTSFLTFSQNQKDKEVFSVYFNSQNCEGYKNVKLINKNHFGLYTVLSDKKNDIRKMLGDDLHIDSSGIYILKNRIIGISREEVRENSKYEVKNSYLHGVIENDSVFVILEDETYYFLIPSKAYLYDNQSTNNSLVEINNNNYLIFTKEKNGYYTCVKMEISKSKISLYEFSISFDKLATLNKNETTENGIPTFIINPTTNADWNLILKEFAVYDQYKFVK